MEHRPEDPLNQNKGKFHTWQIHFSLGIFFLSEFSLDHFHPDLGHSGVNQLGGAFVNGRPLPESERIFFIICELRMIIENIILTEKENS